MYGRAGIAWAALLMYFAGSARAVMTISRSTVPDWTVSIAYSQALAGSDCTLGLCYVVCLGEHPARAHVGKRFGVRVGGDLRDTDYDLHLYVYSHGYRRCSSRL